MRERFEWEAKKLPLLAGSSYCFEGHFPSPEAGDFRIRTFLYPRGGGEPEQKTYEREEFPQSGYFRITRKISWTAESCRIVFERKDMDSAPEWEEGEVCEYDVRFWPSERWSWIGRLAMSWIRKPFSRGFYAIARVLVKTCPSLVARVTKFSWTSFVEAADRTSPREVWESEMSPRRRNALWAHVHCRGNQIGSLFQYPPRETVFDSLPVFENTGKTLPKVTVVTPSYNQGHFLAATMDSVLENSGVDVDYIVMDGGSKDSSVEVIEKRADRLKHWQSAPDGGQAAAIHSGMQHAECGPDDIMAYLNSDDVFCPGAVAYVAAWFAENPDVDAVYGHRIIIDAEDREVGRWVLPPHDNDVLSKVDLIPQETLFWRRRIYDLAGGIDPSFRFAMDWDFLLRMQNAGAVFRRLPYFLGCFRVHEEQKTQANILDIGAEEIESLRVRENGGTPLAPDLLRNAVQKIQVESLYYASKLDQGHRL